MTRRIDQVAAVPIRRRTDGDIQVLLVTSRGTGRWVVPKGWRMSGKELWEAARVEAAEEAGAEGRISKQAIGEFTYDKGLDGRGSRRCRVRVFPMLVRRLKPDWLERDQRERKWFRPKKAAEAVDEPELSSMLRGLDDEGSRAPAVRRLLTAS